MAAVFTLENDINMSVHGSDNLQKHILRLQRLADYRQIIATISIIIESSTYISKQYFCGVGISIQFVRLVFFFYYVTYYNPTKSYMKCMCGSCLPTYPNFLTHP